MNRAMPWTGPEPSPRSEMTFVPSAVPSLVHSQLFRDVVRLGDWVRVPLGVDGVEKELSAPRAEAVREDVQFARRERAHEHGPLARAVGAPQRVGGEEVEVAPQPREA